MFSKVFIKFLFFIIYLLILIKFNLFSERDKLKNFSRYIEHFVLRCGQNTGIEYGEAKIHAEVRSRD